MEGAEVSYSALQLRAYTSLLKRMLLLLLCSAVFSIAIIRFVSMVEAAKIIPVTPPVATKSAVAAATTLTPTPPKGTTAAAKVTSCTPFGNVPTPTGLPMTAPGLQQLIDTPQTYGIYGNDPNTIAQQLHDCAPSSSEGNFSGETAYWIGTHYNYTLTPAASCHLSDITVAIHISQILPAWQGGGNTALASKWAAYERSLVLHENGHSVIDIAQAQSLHSELSALPDLPCDQISAAADNIVATHITALNKANDDYDAATNHGATQGAIW